MVVTRKIGSSTVFEFKKAREASAKAASINRRFGTEQGVLEVEDPRTKKKFFVVVKPSGLVPIRGKAKPLKLLDMRDIL